MEKREKNKTIKGHWNEINKIARITYFVTSTEGPAIRLVPVSAIA